MMKVKIISFISFYSPVHGLIFLFKWRSGEEVDGSIVRDSRLDEIFFAKQVRQKFFWTYCKNELYRPVLFFLTMTMIFCVIPKWNDEMNL